MSRGRVAFLAVLVACLSAEAFLSPSAPASATFGEGICAAPRVEVTSRADTIFIRHLDAERNCCTDLAVRAIVAGYIAEFYEGDAGDSCRCTCCFDLSYDASGFPAGLYTVRVLSDDGTIVHGEATVEVAGSGEAPVLGASSRGECKVTPTERANWGRLKVLYR